MYLPSTRRITISADVLFDESFQTAIVTNWRHYQDSLALQPEPSFIPNINITLESTGSIENRPKPVEEVEFEEGNDDDDEPLPLLLPEDDDSVSDDEADSDEEDDSDDVDTIGPQEDTSPFIMDSSSSHQHHPKHDRRAPQIYTDEPRQTAKHWTPGSDPTLF